MTWLRWRLVKWGLLRLWTVHAMQRDEAAGRVYGFAHPFFAPPVARIALMRGRAIAAGNGYYQGVTVD